jgi:hypothetical protein
MEKFEAPFLYGVTFYPNTASNYIISIIINIAIAGKFLIDRDRDSLILSVRTDYFVEIHEKITIEELINH